MKSVYIIKTEIETILKDGSKIVSKSDFVNGRYTYKYGDVPDKEVFSYSIDGKFNEDAKELFDRYYRVLEYFKMGLFSKREYIKVRTSCTRWEALDIKDIEFINVTRFCEVVENPKIKWLEDDLGFKGYSELVFDREQELKSMLLKG